MKDTTVDKSSSGRKPARPGRGASRRVTIVNDLGLHARAAALVAREAAGARGRVWLAHRGRRADLGCVLSMIALGVSRGQMVTLSAELPEDGPVLDRVKALAARGFKELKAPGGRPEHAKSG